MPSIQKEIENFQTLTQASKDKQALKLYKAVQKSSLSQGEKDDFIASLYASDGLRSIQQYNSEIANSWGLEFIYMNQHIRMSKLLAPYALTYITIKVIVNTIVAMPGNIKKSINYIGKLLTPAKRPVAVKH